MLILTKMDCDTDKCSCQSIDCQIDSDEEDDYRFNSYNEDDLYKEILDNKRNKKEDILRIRYTLIYSNSASLICGGVLGYLLAYYFR